MKEKLNTIEKKQILKYTIAGAILILLYFLMRNLDDLTRFLLDILAILTPFIIGYGFSFILHPLEKWFDRLLPIRNDKRRNISAVFISVLIGLIGFGLILLFIIPDLIASIIAVSEQLPSLISSLQSFYNNIELNENVAQFLQDGITQAQQFLVNTLQQSVSQILYGALDFTNLVLNFFLAIAISIYISLNREYLSRNFKKMSLAIFGIDKTKHLINLTQISSNVFKQFFYSKGFSSILLGLAAFVLLSLFNVKYALLVSTVFGLFNLIPLFGFILSLLFIALFLMLVHIQAIITTLLILVALKTIENIFVTKNLFGEPVALPTFWILFALIIGSYLYGFAGLFMSVPLFTIGYISIQKWIDQRNSGNLP